MTSAWPGRKRANPKTVCNTSAGVTIPPTHQCITRGASEEKPRLLSMRMVPPRDTLWFPAGVVEVDPDTARFVLPAEHAAFLTRVAAADNMAVSAQYIVARAGWGEPGRHVG